MEKETITINLIDDDFTGAYTDPWNCPISRALRRLGIMQNPSVGVYDVDDIDGTRYLIPSEQDSTLAKSWNRRDGWVDKPLLEITLTKAR